MLICCWGIRRLVAETQVESEGKNFFDDDVIYEKRLHLEWNNALTKGRFIKVWAVPSAFQRPR